MEFGQLHHVEYYVNDLKSSNKFWDWFMVDMGYEKMESWPGGISWKHSTGTYLVFVQVEEEHLELQNNRQGNGLNHIAFMGATLTQLDETQKKLESHNIKILKRKDEYLCFEDPNGFAVEVYAAV